MAEKRYIDASMLSELAEMEYIYFASPAAVPFYEADKVWEILENAPAADVAEVKHGAWIVTRYHLYLNVYEEFLCCSVCGYEHQHDERFEYCPNCGAKMDGKGGGNE